jgi:hypothetical protein
MKAYLLLSPSKLSPPAANRFTQILEIQSSVLEVMFLFLCFRFISLFFLHQYDHIASLNFPSCTFKEQIFLGKSKGTRSV